MNGKSTYTNMRSPKSDTFVGTLIVENDEATGGTMKNWVTSVAESSGIYTVTFNTGISFPVTPVCCVTMVSTAGTAIRGYAVITQQFTNSTRTLKYKLLLDDGAGNASVTAAADIFVNIILVCPLTAGS